MFHPVAAAIDDLKSGQPIIVVDDENRENEGDLIAAAQFATPQVINFMAIEARGLICLAMQGPRLDELEIPLMVGHNTDSNQTAFTVSIDAGPELGVTTGISAADRSRTIQAAIHPHTRPSDLRRPGHIFPLRAREGGVLKRAGHTEAAVDLCVLAGLYPAGVICEIQNPDGSMARLAQLLDYAQHHQLKIITIASLIDYRLQHERLVQLEASAAFPTEHGDFQIYIYRDTLDHLEHIALVKGDNTQFSQQPVLVRVHTEYFLGDTLGSLRSDSRRQLETALKIIEHQGQGVVVYLTHQKSLSLADQVKNYALEDRGLNRKSVWLPSSELRNYGIGAQILRELGVRQMRLLTNTPRKIGGLKGFGLEIVERVPLLLEANGHTMRFLKTYPGPSGQVLQTYLATLALDLDLPAPLQPEQRALWVENVRRTALAEELVIQEERRPLALAIFGAHAVVIQVGLEYKSHAPVPWYEAHTDTFACCQAILRVLLRLAQLVEVNSLAWMVSSGSDPLDALREDLKEVMISLEIFQADHTLHWQEKTIYRLAEDRLKQLKISRV